MDLAQSSSTAQKEEKAYTAVQPEDDRKDHFIERDGVRFAGTHLIIDLYGARRLDDLAHIERALKRCVEVAGATLLHIHLHHFTPNGGVSGVAVLAEARAVYASGAFGVVTELHVVPELRGRGLGARLIAACRREATWRGWRRLEVTTPDAARFAATQRFYATNGFSAIGPRLRLALA